MRLKNKINLYTTVLFIALLLSMNLFIYFLFNTLIINSELERAHIEAKSALKGINESIGEVPQKDLIRAYVPIDGMIRIVTADKKVLSTVTSSSEKPLSKMNVEFFNGEQSKRIEYNGSSYSFESLPLILTDGQVANIQITKSLYRAVENFKTLQLVLLIVSLIVMIPVVASSRVLSKIITTPITSMIETMTQIRKDGQFKRIQLEGKSKDELAEMGDTFNHMIDMLETNSEKQQQFASNASHELKTPLTVIESYASLLKRRGREEPEIFDEAVDAVYSEAIRMREMTEQLLLLAQPNEKWAINKEQLYLMEIVEESRKAFRKAYDREITLNIEQNPIVSTDKQRLKQLLYILLDNARKYSQDTIMITIGQQGEQAFIKMADRGIGIPKEDLPKIFDRFYRVDKTRSRIHGGTGLGLSLAKELARGIDADVIVDSIEGIGTTVTILFK